MIPQVGQHIKCIFRNGTIIEGLVENWGPVAQLRSLSDQSLMIICHPAEDIMMIKIVPEPLEEQVKECLATPMREEIVEKLEEIRAETDTDLQSKSIVELRNLVGKQEREIISKKIKENFPSAYSPHKPSYGSQMDLLPRGRKR